MTQAFYHNKVGKDTKKETCTSFLLPSWFLVQFYVACYLVLHGNHLMTCQGPDMAWLVSGCPPSSFSCLKSLCFVCWCLSVFVFRCGGCCSRCCTLLVCLARAMTKPLLRNLPFKLGKSRLQGFLWLWVVSKLQDVTYCGFAYIRNGRRV